MAVKKSIPQAVEAVAVKKTVVKKVAAPVKAVASVKKVATPVKAAATNTNTVKGKTTKQKVMTKAMPTSKLKPAVKAATPNSPVKK